MADVVDRGGVALHPVLPERHGNGNQVRVEPLRRERGHEESPASISDVADHARDAWGPRSVARLPSHAHLAEGQRGEVHHPDLASGVHGEEGVVRRIGRVPITAVRLPHREVDGAGYRAHRDILDLDPGRSGSQPGRDHGAEVGHPGEGHRGGRFLGEIDPVDGAALVIREEKDAAGAEGERPDRPVVPGSPGETSREDLAAFRIGRGHGSRSDAPAERRGGREKRAEQCETPVHRYVSSGSRRAQDGESGAPPALRGAPPLPKEGSPGCRGFLPAPRARCDPDQRGGEATGCQRGSGTRSRRNG